MGLTLVRKMITLGELTAWLLVALSIAWIWRGHGVRERALAYARAHCERETVQLLDGNVAFKGWQIIADGSQRKRLARLYGFEFTVTSHERLNGTVAMYGRHLAKIELQAYPLPESIQAVHADSVLHTQSGSVKSVPSRVVQLDDWRPKHQRSD